MRPNNRALDQLREVSFEAGANAYAEGSCLAKFGGTHVLCTASIDAGVPRWLKGKGRGWVTAEYGMLPRSTHTRNSREAARGKQSGRTVEISRLIGRSLRAVIDLEKLGERQIIVDCDVMQADGGTRTASISGGWVALWLACEKLVKDGELTENPMFANMAAVSCGIVEGECRGGIIEVQASAEDTPFTAEEMNELTRLAVKGIGELCQLQQAAIK